MLVSDKLSEKFIVNVVPETGYRIITSLQLRKPARNEDGKWGFNTPNGFHVTGGPARKYVVLSYIIRDKEITKPAALITHSRVQASACYKAWSEWAQAKQWREAHPELEPQQVAYTSDCPIIMGKKLPGGSPTWGTNGGTNVRATRTSGTCKISISVFGIAHFRRSRIL